MTTAARPAAVVSLKVPRGQWAHPWVYKKMVDSAPDGLEPGAVVEARDKTGRFYARGFYNPHSQIALRVLTRDEKTPVNYDLFRSRLRDAVALRVETLGLDRTTDAYRVVHSEADGLPGIMIDRYGPVAVAEIFSAGFHRKREDVTRAVREFLPVRNVLFRADERIEKLEGFKLDRSMPPGAPKTVTVTENGIRFLVDLEHGHKTGFFADQRDNRRYLAELTEGKVVLDAFCYTGGFGLYAKKAGRARYVVSVDLDEKALAVARENAAMNRAEIDFVHDDVFRYLRALREGRNEFDVVVLDPAKMTVSRDDVPGAVRNYADLNRLAMRRIRNGGLLLTCSCTGLVSEDAFLGAVRSAAAETEREIQILRVSGAGPDHPVTPEFPEGRYLKAVLVRVKHAYRKGSPSSA